MTTAVWVAPLGAVMVVISETVPETPAENAGAETPLEDPGTEAPAESGGGQELPPAEEPPAQDLAVDDPAQAV
jgi:hypothetical protein